MSRPISIPTTTTIIPIHTSTVKTFILPQASINQGKILIFKDIYGTASTNNIYLSTTTTDFVERGSTNRTILSTSYGAWMFTNDGTNTWFLFNAYSNSLSTLSRNSITPLGFSPTLLLIGSTLTSTWTQSVNAITYTVSYYFTNTNANTGGTLIQTISGITTLFNSITTVPIISNYYYVTVTAINTAGQLLITSPTTQPILLPVAPISVILMISGPYLYCYWTAQPYTISYTINFYQTTSQVTTGGTNIQNASNITTTYFLGSVQIINEYYYYAIVTALNNTGSSTSVASSIIFGNILPGNPVSATMGIAVNDVNVQGYWLQTANTAYYTMKIFRGATAVTSGGTLYETITNITGLTAIGTIPLLNSNYYYITVTATNVYGSSSEITGPFTTILILNAPSSLGTVTMSYVGVNAVATWTSVINAISYTIIFYEVTTPVASGGTIFETFTGNVGLTQTSSRALVNAKYYYTIVKGVNTYGTATGITSTNTTTQIANPPQPPTSVTVAYSGGVVSSSWVGGLNTTSYTVIFYYTTSNTPISGTIVETNTESGLSNSMATTAVGDYYYYATVTSVNALGSSSTITSGNVAIITIAPSPATNVAISTSGYYAVCTWTTGTNTATYTVTFYYNSSATTTGGTSFETVTLLAKITTTRTSTIVMPNGYYIYAVVTAVNGYTTIDATSSSTTSQTQFPPTNPSNLIISTNVPNLSVTWTASLYYAISYTIIIYNNGTTNSTTGGTSIETRTGITGLSLTTNTALINGNYYYATIQALNSFSSSSVITSLSAIQAIIAPGNPSLSIQSGVATLSWDAVTNAINYRYVFYGGSANNYTTGSVITYGTTTSLSATVNLYNFVYYYFTIYCTFSASVSATNKSNLVQTTYPGLSLWLDAGDTTTVTGTTSVTAWSDKSGLGNTATAVVGRLPTLTANSQFALSAMIFSGNQQLIGNISLNGSNYTQFVMYLNTTATVGQAIMDSQPSQTLLIQNGGGNQFQTFFTYGGSFQTGGNYQINTVNCVVPASSATIWINGANQNFGLVGGVTGSAVTTYYIGSRFDSIYFTGGLAETLVFNASLSATHQAQIEGYIAWKWGLNLSLPSSHPYYYLQPGIGPLGIGVPIDLQAVFFQIGNNIATLSWYAYPGATGYTWYIFTSTNADFTGILLTSGTTTGLTASYTGLTLNNYYYFAVYATTATSISNYKTSSIVLYNNIPTNLSIQALTTYISMVWDGTNYSTYNWILYQSATNSYSGSQISSGSTASTTAIYSSTLIANYYYYFTVSGSSTAATSSIINYVVAPSAATLSFISGVATMGWTAPSGATGINYTWVLYSNPANNYTGGSVYATGTTASTSATAATVISAFYYFTVIAQNSGTKTSVLTSSIVQSTFSSTISAFTNTFTYNAANQSFTVPAGATQCAVYLWGAGGSGGQATSGGPGASVQGVISTTPGEVLTVIVGNGGSPFVNQYSGTHTGYGGTFVGIKRGNLNIVVAGSGGGAGSYNGNGTTYFGGIASEGPQSFSGGITYAVEVLAADRTTIDSLGGDSHNGGGGNQVRTGQEGVDYGLGGREGAGYYSGGQGGIFGPGNGGGGAGSSYTAMLTPIPGVNVLGYHGIDMNPPNTSSAFYSAGIAKGGFTMTAGGNGRIVIKSVTQTLVTPWGLTLLTVSDTATMTWTPYPFAVSYTWGLYQSTTTNFTGILVGSGTITNGLTYVYYKGLLLNNYYYFSLVARNNSGVVSGYATSPLMLYNAGVPTGGSVVINLFAFDIIGGNITITAANNASLYTVYISTTTSSANSIKTFTTTMTSQFVTFYATLNPSTTYYAVVLPSNIYGNAASTFASAGLATGALPTGGTISLTFTNTTSGTVTIGAASGATGYTVYISNSTSIASSSFSFIAAGTTGFTVPAGITLSSGTTYYALMTPYNTIGISRTQINSAGRLL